jgi:hypothetical protein
LIKLLPAGGCSQELMIKTENFHEPIETAPSGKEIPACLSSQLFFGLQLHHSGLRS